MPFSTSPTRLPNGVTNASSWQTMADAGVPDPTWAHLYSNDFDTFVATDWIVTAGSTGTAALADGDGGILALTTAATASDNVQLQLSKSGFQLAPLHDVFFKFSGTVSDVAAPVYCGLISRSVTPLTANDGLYLVSTAVTGALTLVSKIGGVTRSVALPAACVLKPNVPFELGIHVDPQGNVEAFWNPTTGNVPASPAIFDAVNPQPRGAVANLMGGGLTQALLTPSFGFNAGSTATVKTLSVDYVVAVKC